MVLRGAQESWSASQPKVDKPPLRVRIVPQQCQPALCQLTSMTRWGD